jgi:hypothetical protein
VTSKGIEEVNQVWSEMFSEKEGEDFMATLAEQLMQQGIEKGRQEGETNAVLRLLQKRLGVIDEKTRDAIQELNLVHIEQLSEALLDFKDLSDLNEWLKQKAN